MNLALLRQPGARRAAIIALGLLTAAGLVTGREHPSHEEATAKPVEAPPAPAPAIADIDLARLHRAEPPSAQGDPFAPKSFAEAPKPAPGAAPAASAPSAPPLPFAYAGKVTANGRTEVLLVRGEELVPVAPGENIDTEYRVDAITDKAIRFTYLPLKKRQSLEIGEAGG